VLFVSLWFFSPNLFKPGGNIRRILTTYISGKTVRSLAVRYKQLSKHLTQNQIEGYGRRTLSAAELLSTSDHLVDCGVCRLQVERALDSDAAFFALRSELFDGTDEASSLPLDQTHLTMEQTADYVDGVLAGEQLQVVKDHLTCCEQCVMAVEDLGVFKKQVAPDLDHEFQPLAIQTVPVNRWHRLISYLLPRPAALVFGSALTMLLVIAAGWLIWQALGPKEKTPTITQTPSPTTPALTPVVPPTPAPEGTEEILLAKLNDGGGQILLDRSGKLSGVESLPPSYQQLVKRALTNQQLEKSPSLAGLTEPGSLVIRGGDKEGDRFSLIEPIGKVVLSDHPTFRWSRLDGATSYVVEIYDDKFAMVATSSQLTDLSWTAPQSLQGGAAYSWQVKAIKDGQEFITPRAPAPLAKFRILDQAKANELVQARRNYASSHLALALLYTQAGLLDEADRELRALQKANPNSAIVNDLLTNLQVLQGRKTTKTQRTQRF
jgi:hypothetical protein